MTISDSIQNLRRSIRETAVRERKDPESVRLVIVTKTVAVERIFEAYHAGERDFGENRVQEWEAKKGGLPDDVRWHLIGYLQTNKVKHVVGKVALIHSLDRAELADAIEKRAKFQSVPEVPCLVQVNMSGEESKSGLDPAKVDDLVRQMPMWPSIRIRGVMCVGPLTEDQERIRDCFRKTRELRDDLRAKFPQYDWSVLSMGMSSDYRIAIEEGANMLRIGSLVFPRDGSV